MGKVPMAPSAAGAAGGDGLPAVTLAAGSPSAAPPPTKPAPGPGLRLAAGAAATAPSSTPAAWPQAWPHDVILDRLPPAFPFAMLRQPSESSASSISAPARNLCDTADLIRAACELPPLGDEGRLRVIKPALQGGEEALLKRIRFRWAA
jgi:hypothetical protein